ncbi:MAG: class I SAM-dependent methyltransferase [Methanomassiliicoccaceae archaeon]|nr:class I SAM-dependent methyltransferase [Methanomassiliicoccaceae archaeon]
MEYNHCGEHGSAPGRDQKEFFDRLAGEWDTITVHDGEKIRYIVSLLELKGEERILDVGTGTGVMIPFYCEHLITGSVLGVDFSEKMISKCKEKFPPAGYPNIAFETADVYDLSCDGEFDTVMCYSCFPHFTDHQKAIDIFSKALKRGGRFAIAHSSSRDHINHVHSHSSHHIRRDVLPHIEELEAMFIKAGLSVIFDQSDEEYHIIIGEKQ